MRVAVPLPSLPRPAGLSPADVHAVAPAPLPRESPRLSATFDPLAISWDRALAWAQGAPLRVVMIVLGAIATRWLVHRAINGFVHGLLLSSRAAEERAAGTQRVQTSELPILSRQMRRASKIFGDPAFISATRQEQRVRTLGAVLRSVTTVVVAFVAALMIGEALGFNMAPLLASASVGGVALGFGAQSLVKDYLSGMFMIVEDQYGVGDVVDTGEVIGTVENVSLRLTTIRDFNGVIWYIRNGEILRVANRSQGWSTALVDIPVPVTEPMERVLPIISRAVRGMDTDPELDGKITEEPEVGGVESISAGVATVRIIVKCAPNESIVVARQVRSRVMATLSAEGISLPTVPVVPSFGPGVLPYAGSETPK
ncbi:mechanosensitive ion channel family protein [Arsenicicoccus dermatophilus]|uniref:mechanosensitive ion channel family protein n=1 Tax=Arsenicicoccus dermatophilus TaxID=1076331 RepID=UPI001F4C9BAE|nr:mechanosensitive ion channel domain-containing protein [Arsenicicoccus dermatophilus]MCH8613405.1 mechanosensitive ion channel family protein [Arsenicicoccus dermatophilus]